LKSHRVYSTDQGRICPSCDQAKDNCRCKAAVTTDKGDGIIRIRRETKGRKGAGVTIIDGLVLEASELKKLVKKIKQSCSSGGAIKDSSVEIQGEHREGIKALLEKAGYTVKLSGG
jgi:translation initiation factor 1